MIASLEGEIASKAGALASTDLIALGRHGFHARFELVAAEKRCQQREQRREDTDRNQNGPLSQLVQPERGSGEPTLPEVDVLDEGVDGGDQRFVRRER